MDKLFTININKDENIRLYKTKENNEYIKIGCEEINQNNGDIIETEFNEINKTDNFDLLGDLSIKQANEYENIRKKIREYVLKCFEDDNILKNKPEDSEDNSPNETNMDHKNFKLKLRKDKMVQIITYVSQEKYKKNKPNEASSRYYIDSKHLNEKVKNECNDIDEIISDNTFLKELNDQIKKIDYNEEIFKEKAQKVQEKNEIKEINFSEDNNNENKNISNKKKKNKVMKNTTNIDTENAVVDLRLNNVIENFQEKIKNWLVRFPDINSENFFFHLYFLVELSKDKKIVCQHCGSIGCEKDEFSRFKCKNTYCFLCNISSLGYMCHNTRTQYMALKTNVNIINEYKNIKFPFKSISCLNCLKNNHYKCGSPPYIFAKYSYNFRRLYSNKLDQKNFVYLGNPQNVWEINNKNTDKYKNNENSISNLNRPSIKNSTSGLYKNINRNNKTRNNSNDNLIHKNSNSNNNNKINLYSIVEQGNKSEKELNDKNSFKKNIQIYKQKRNFPFSNLENNNIDAKNKKHKSLYHDTNKNNYTREINYDNKNYITKDSNYGTKNYSTKDNSYKNKYFQENKFDNKNKYRIEKNIYDNKISFLNDDHYINDNKISQSNNRYYHKNKYAYDDNNNNKNDNKNNYNNKDNPSKNYNDYVQNKPKLHKNSTFSNNNSYNEYHNFQNKSHNIQNKHLDANNNSYINRNFHSNLYNQNSNKNGNTNNKNKHFNSNSNINTRNYYNYHNNKRSNNLYKDTYKNNSSDKKKL